jgi:anthranilate 1,2-dioxygenase large subunit/terephthalate 1,2-dioxygenase oxygenase component alpha subunit
MRELAVHEFDRRPERVETGRMTVSQSKPQILVWPEGVSRTPYAVYSDEEIYIREQERIFRGPTWHFLAMEAQLPQVNSFVQAQVGDTPVVVTRDAEGEIHAMVNRCSHKGTPLVFTPSGKLPRLMCVYHNWCFELNGRLRSVAFERGVKGKGGMPPDFRKEEHGLQRLRVHRLAGLIFGTLDPAAPDFENYVGPELVANTQRVCRRELVVLGTYSQLLQSNWKLYVENVQDPYHASLLHAFNGMMKMDRLTMEGGVIASGGDGRHHISFSKMTADQGGEIYDRSADLRSSEISAYGQGLRDRAMAEAWDDHGDGVSLTVQTMFPAFVQQQLRNSLALRTVIPKGPRATELRWIAFGYADDDERKRIGRLKQANMMGPAGFIAMEDGMIGGLVQRGIEGDKDKASYMRMGGDGTEPIPGSRTTEGSVRGFWAGYRALMGL